MEKQMSKRTIQRQALSEYYMVQDQRSSASASEYPNIGLSVDQVLEAQDSCVSLSSNQQEVEMEADIGSKEFEVVQALNHFGSSNASFQSSANLSDRGSEFSAMESELNLIDRREQLQTALCNWVKAKDPDTAMVNDLLHRLEAIEPGLPRDYRTLMKTERKVSVKTVEPGHYYHFGVKAALNFVLANCLSLLLMSTVFFHLFIDGAQVYRSTTCTIWPIFGRLRDLCDCSFIIGIYCGDSKPAFVNDFLADCIAELHSLISAGFIMPNGKCVPFILRMVMCDTPARSYVKSTKHCTGYFSCDKCVVEGEYVARRVCFVDVSAPLRTDDMFRTPEAYIDHIRNRQQSPFLSLAIDMIKCFPLDPMHLIYEGAVFRILKSLSAAHVDYRVPSLSIRQISTTLTSLRSCITHDFPRRPRSLNVLKLWKATELRMFILYLAPVALKGIVSSVMYQLILSLHTFTFLMSHPVLCSHYCDFSEDLIKWFVSECTKAWGPEFIVFSIHALIHVPNDVRLFGCLENFSCFWGENFIRFFTKFCRGPSFTLQQVVKRVLERDVTLGYFDKFSGTQNVSFSGIRPIPNITVHHLSISGAFSKVILPDRHTFISNLHPDCYVFTKQGAVVCVKHILSCVDNSFILVGLQYRRMEPFYDSAVNSLDINIVVVSDLSCDLSFIPSADLLCKGMLLKQREGSLVALPILHTF
ncbi:hypothetical protein BOX15_Mlig018882g2 [Macrostomum lignano]|uniref:DUF4218 domain-containing protein n=1 Tax=Macrostomum lignano TaxID=282301 RepID=A0A267F660_9PLAT|nr:hypothetical protein BOX15_Mlig018882g2 [Macrostomum lignano]